MPAPELFVDIHCHLLPGIDDGAADWAETLAMARIAAEEGIGIVVATPHQLGNFAHNRGDHVRALAGQVQAFLEGHGMEMRVLPGADVRIDDGMVDRLVQGDVLTLGDHRRHVLLELPHELYLPLEGLLDQLAAQDLIGILSHPERNLGILRNPAVLEPLVEAGCLMQVTAGSLRGAFGPEIQRFSDRLVQEGLVHVVSTDAHGSKTRPPRMRRAFDRLVELADLETAIELCCRNPARIAEGQDIPQGRRAIRKPGLARRLRSQFSGFLSNLS